MSNKIKNNTYFGFVLFAIIILLLATALIGLSQSGNTPAQGSYNQSGTNSGGGSPTGAAGGTLTGTYPNPGLVTTINQNETFANGLVYGSTTGMGLGSVSYPIWYLAGNPAEAVIANAGSDYGFQLLSLNAFARQTWSIGYSTTNASHYNSGSGTGPLLTNSAGNVIGGVLNQMSFVVENEQGGMNNMPLVGNIVNNDQHIAISTSFNAIGAGIGDYPWYYNDPVSGKWGTPFWDTNVFTNIYANSISNANSIVWAFSINPATASMTVKSNATIGGTVSVAGASTFGLGVSIGTSTIYSSTGGGTKVYGVTANGVYDIFDGANSDIAFFNDEGLKLPVGGLSMNVLSKSTSYSIGLADNTILVTATGQTVTLPTAVSDLGAASGRYYTIKLTAAGSCTITNSTGAQTIDGNLSYTLSGQNSFITVQSDGSNWQIVNLAESDYVVSTIPQGSAINYANTVLTNITSISLPPGDWDVQGAVNDLGATATITLQSSAINTVSKTLAADGTDYQCGYTYTSVTALNSMPITRKRINVTSTTTVYLVSGCSFSTGTLIGWGTITARRFK